MAVPVETYALGLFVDYSADKLHHFPRAVGSRVPDRIANTDRASAAANRGGIQRADRIRIGARRIFGDEHYRQAFTDRKGHSFFSHLQELIEGPFLGEKTNRRRADEGAGFDGNAGALRNLGNRRDVIAMSTRGAVGAYPEFFVGNF